MSYDPKKYIIPYKTGFIILPFGEDVASEDWDAAPIMTAQQVTDAVHGIDVSLVVDPDPDVWTVSWMHGSELEPGDLAEAYEKRVDSK